MAFLARPQVTIALGALLVLALAFGGTLLRGPLLAEQLGAKASAAIAAAGGRPVEAHFTNKRGWATRHPVLYGGETLNDAVRDKVAKAVAAIPGVGGVSWSDGTARAATSPLAIHPLHCQKEVEALLRARTIRFEEASARIDPGSVELVDEVVAALRPCLGSIIAITGHTDSSGPEPGNLALSLERAVAVRDALMARGIPADGLRAQGVGSRNPVPGLERTDPANRRIEFTVISSQPIVPTAVDTPGPH